eukprot:gene4342-6145_t
MRYGSYENADENVEENLVTLNNNNSKKNTHDSKTENGNKKSFLSKKLNMFIFAIFAVVGTYVLMSSSSSSNSVSVASPSLSENPSESELAITPDISPGNRKINYSLNRVGYPLLQYFNQNERGSLKYLFLVPHAGIIEPYASMELTLFGDSVVSSRNYEYTICDSKETKTCISGSTKYSSTSEYSASSFKFSCSPHEKFSLAVKEFDENGQLLTEDDSTAVCMTVRREIRDLSNEDLKSFIIASHEMYELSDQEGQRLYGPEYRSNSYLLQYHFFNAAQQDSDHIHEGNGFLLQHVKLSNMFENAVRAINPALSLPYWDFTIDAQKGVGVADSFIMKPEVYGTVTKPKDISAGFGYNNDKLADAAIPDGLWKGLKAEMNMFPDLTYGYGYLRSPWNMNPSPYISRYVFEFDDVDKEIPTCNSHYKMLADYDDMTSFMYKIQFIPHGATHVGIGGMYGCDKFQPLIDGGYIKDTTSANALCTLWFTFVKEWWRFGYYEPKKDCVVNTEKPEDSECGFICDDTKKKTMISYLFQLESRNLNTEIDDAYDVWADFVCEGDGSKIFAGDHLESASPADPSFWVIHPTLERLLHAKFMVGGFATEEWATDDKNDYVCNHPSCYDSSSATTGYFDSCCVGHYEDSRLMDASQKNNEAFFGITNREALEATDPRRLEYSMPYVYDKFTWDHCTDDDILGLLRSQAEKYKSKK